MLTGPRLTGDLYQSISSGFMKKTTNPVKVELPPCGSRLTDGEPGHMGHMVRQQPPEAVSEIQTPGNNSNLLTVLSPEAC